MKVQFTFEIIVHKSNLVLMGHHTKVIAQVFKIKVNKSFGPQPEFQHFSI